MNWIFASSLLLLLLSCLLVSSSLAWSPSRLHYIDRSTTQPNFLFRGSEPVSGGKFIYDELVATIRAAAARDMNLTLPSNFYLIGTPTFLDFERRHLLYDLDFNLLSVELSDLYIEINFFKQNATLGQFIHYPILGDLVGYKYNNKWPTNTLN